MITSEQLTQIGCNEILWNGAYSEYYLPIIEGISHPYCESRLSVTIGESENDPCYVSIVIPQGTLRLEHIKTIGQFKQLYALLTGSKVKTSKYRPIHDQLDELRAIDNEFLTDTLNRVFDFLHSLPHDMYPFGLGLNLCKCLEALNDKED